MQMGHSVSPLSRARPITWSQSISLCPVTAAASSSRSLVDCLPAWRAGRRAATAPGPKEPTSLAHRLPLPPPRLIGRYAWRRSPQTARPPPPAWRPSQRTGCLPSPPASRKTTGGVRPGPWAEYFEHLAVPLAGEVSPNALLDPDGGSSRERARAVVDKTLLVKLAAAEGAAAVPGEAFVGAYARSVEDVGAAQQHLILVSEALPTDGARRGPGRALALAEL
eukprot:CAMPEP_0114288534 /NCGR_PEP_ID=MMETSP0059-20121206/6868_1 /TAXON_ID=36894 /ORGANISM="Pyramimonas parkeae, Strain CCMP726" /LENGTH=221 /DNA_ID=CAMNT_0001409699 /DNA_START=277 /DNA_END=944 /DNA_ORIENTATION=-